MVAGGRGQQDQGVVRSTIGQQGQQAWIVEKGQPMVMRTRNDHGCHLAGQRQRLIQGQIRHEPEPVGAAIALATDPNNPHALTGGPQGGYKESSGGFITLFPPENKTAAVGFGHSERPLRTVIRVHSGLKQPVVQGDNETVRQGDSD